MSLEWFRCNKCFISLKSMKVGCVPFSLTQCGHVFCLQCIQKVINTSECLECKATGVQALQLTDSLPGAVRHIFEPMLDVGERMVLAAKFQSTQMMVIHKRFEVMEKKYFGLKVTYMKIYKQLEELKKNYERMMNSRKADYTPQNVAPSSVPRNYFNPTMFIQSSEAKRTTPRNSQHLPQHNYRMEYQSDDNYLTDSSNASSSTVRLAPRNDQSTPDGLFRIPNIRKIPRSTGTSSHSSSGIGSINSSTQPGNHIF